MSLVSNRSGAVLTGLYVILFTATVDNQLLIPLLPRLREDLATDVSALGLLFSVYALTATAANLVLGPLSDGKGRLGFLRAGILLLAGTSIATQFCGSFRELLVLRGAAGIAGGVLSVSASALVGDWFSYRKRGRAVGVLLSAHFAALIFGIPISVQMAERFRWQAGFLGIVVLALLALLFSLLAFPSGQRNSRRRSEGWVSYRIFWKDPGMRGSLLVSFLTSGATLAFLAFLSGLGLTVGQITLLLMATGASAVLGAPVAGWLSDWFSKRLVFLFANTLLVIPLVVVAATGWGVRLFVLFACLMLLAAARQTALQAVQTELSGPTCRGAFLGLRNGFSQLGISCSVLVASYLFAWRGFPGVVALTAGLTLTASLVFFLLVSEPESV